MCQTNLLAEVVRPSFSWDFQILVKLDHRLALPICSPLYNRCKLIVVLGKAERNAVREPVRVLECCSLKLEPSIVCCPPIQIKVLKSCHLRMPGTQHSTCGVLAGEGQADQQQHDWRLWRVCFKDVNTRSSFFGRYYGPDSRSLHPIYSADVQ